MRNSSVGKNWIELSIKGEKQFSIVTQMIRMVNVYASAMGLLLMERSSSEFGRPGVTLCLLIC